MALRALKTRHRLFGKMYPVLFVCVCVCHTLRSYCSFWDLPLSSVDTSYLFFFNFLFFDGIRGTVGEKSGIRAGSVGIRGPPFISMGINLGSVAGSVVPWGLEIDVGITGKKTHTPTHLHAYTHTRTPTIARETHTDSD